MESLLSLWLMVKERLHKSRQIMLFSDYDGTLTPIVERPELARLGEEVRERLRSLVGLKQVRVAIISGRSLADLKSRVGVGGIIYSGNHGLEIEGPGLRFVNSAADETRPVMQLLCKMLGDSVGKISGVLVEDKGLSLSVHYRQVAEELVTDVGRMFTEVMDTAGVKDKVKVTFGKKVYEVRPRVYWNKGKAVDLIIRRYRESLSSSLLPLYFGDDLTDEDAFKTVVRYGGIAVLVGERIAETGARYTLDSPEEVGAFLEVLSKELRGNFP